LYRLLELHHHASTVLPHNDSMGLPTRRHTLDMCAWERQPPSREPLMNNSDMPYNGTPGDTSQTMNRTCDLPGLSETFFQNTLICLAILDADFNFIQVSQSYANACQKRMKDFPGHNFFDVYPSNAQSIFEDVRRRKLSHTALGHPFIFPDCPERGVTYWDWTLEPIVDASGTISLFVLLLHDATNLKRAEHTLASVERDAQQAMRLLDATRDGLFIFEEDTLRFSYVNQGAIQQTGYSRQELLQMTPLDLKTNFDPMTFRALLEPLAIGRLPISSFETIHRRRDGRLVPVEINLQCVPLTTETSRFIAVVRDITERKQAEQLLIAERNHLRQLLDSLYGFVAVLSLDGVIEDVNDAPLALMGLTLDEVIGKPIWNIGWAKSEEVPTIQEAVRTAAGGEHVRADFTACFRTVGDRIVDGVFSPLKNIAGEVTNVVAFGVDVTDRKLVEERLRHTSKLEAIGKLASGIAHDFNNLLTVINGYSETMLGTISAEDPLYTSLCEVSHAGKRASALTQQLLAFSRQQVIQPRALRLNTAVTGLTSMLHRLIGEHIHLVTSLEPNTGPIKIDPVQIEQVIVNLVVNASDAMPQGGTLTIETHKLSTPNGQAVQLIVRDTGLGMDDMTLSRIFEPFYTTKPVGKGTGLGLSVVYGIVTQNGGRIHVESRLHQGSAFIIEFPCTPVEDEEVRIPTATKSERDLHGKETILLVEDDEAVRRYLTHALSVYDYHILEAASPDEALQQATRHHHKINLLITDMVMPGMNGQQLITHILKQDSSIKVLGISGYDASVESLHDQAQQQIHFMEKPFKPHTFVHMVRHILDEDAHAASDTCANSMTSLSSL